MHLKLLSFLLAITLLPFSLSATIVTPPSDMAMMVEHAEIIVYGKVLTEKDQYGYINDFQVIDAIKGSLTNNQVIQIREYGENNGEMSSQILGDVDYEVGTHYLLFLFQDGGGYYRAEMLALSVYKEMMINNTAALVHTEQILDLCFTEQPVSELRYGYDKKSFLQSIKTSVTNKKKWQSQDAIVWTNEKQETSLQVLAGNPPSHCTLVNGTYNSLAPTCTNNSPARYANPVFQVKVANSASTDGSLANEIPNLTTAVTELNNISGISVSLASPLVQACATVGCTNIFNVSALCNPNEQNDIWVFFEDPCNQIGPLNGCSGTLGIGGTWAWNAPRCNTDGCGNTWRDALRPFFFMNDGAGCVGDYKYTALIIHEMLHSINVGHIAGSCSAIMNASICNSNATNNEPNFGITQLDTDCIEYMYDISNDPCNGCSISNVQVTSGPSCNGTNVDLSVQFTTTNGSGAYDIKIGGVVVSSVSGAANGTVTANINNIALVSGSATITVCDSNDTACSASTAATIPTCVTCALSNLQITSGPSCNGPNVDIGLSFDVTAGSGNYIVQVNGSSISNISGATSGTVTANLTNTPLAAGGATITIIDANDSGCSVSSTTTIPNCSGTPCLFNANEVGQTYNSNVYILVENEITSNQCVANPGVDVTYDADTYILMTDLVINQNATFTAIIVGCAP